MLVHVTKIRNVVQRIAQTSFADLHPKRLKPIKKKSAFRIMLVLVMRMPSAVLNTVPISFVDLPQEKKRSMKKKNASPIILVLVMKMLNVAPNIVQTSFVDHHRSNDGVEQCILEYAGPCYEYSECCSSNCSNFICRP